MRLELSLFAILSLQRIDDAIGANLRDVFRGLKEKDGEGNSEKANVRTYVQDIVPSTGFNDICGEKIVDHFGPSMQFCALHNTGGGEPIKLTKHICETQPNALLGTYANRHFYLHVKKWELPDPRLENIPYNEVPITVFLDGLRSAVPDHVPGVAQPVPSHSLPNAPETIATFTGVGGSMELTCNDDDGTAQVEIHGEDYMPGEILTIWVLWNNSPESNLPKLLPMALGGSPNMVVVDEDGEFTFKRRLNFCPLDLQNNGTSRVFSFAIAKHLDGGCTYGNVPQNVAKELKFRVPGTTNEFFTSKGVGPGIMTVDKGHITIDVAQFN